jgi:hypothetical protein
LQVLSYGRGNAVLPADKGVPVRAGMVRVEAAIAREAGQLTQEALKFMAGLFFEFMAVTLAGMPTVPHPKNSCSGLS